MEEITDMFVQDTNLISQTLTSPSIITYTVTLREEITDMFVQDTNLISFMSLQKQTCPSSFLLTYVLFILPRGTKLEYFTTLIYCLVTLI